MARPPKSANRDSRAALLRAAAAEFSSRGYDGAGIDRIARRARVTKAMVYYHFASKLELYREVLRDGFGSLVADAGAAIAAPGSAIDKFDRYVRAFLEAAIRRPHVTPIMMREIAGGGRHLDPATLRSMAELFQVVRRVLDEGRATGEFRDADPLLLHLLIAGAALFYLANEPIRARIRQHHLLGPSVAVPAGTEPFARHMNLVLRRTLCRDESDARDL